MPRCTPAGSGSAQRAAFAVASSTPYSFVVAGSKPRRYSYGSLPAAFASSSTKDSRMNGFCEWPTVRQKPTGTCGLRCAYSMRTLAIAYGWSANATTACGSTPSLSRSEEHTSELQSPDHLVCRLLLEKKKKQQPQKS